MIDLDLMDEEALQRLQTLLKKQYREMPDAVLITLKTQVRLGEEITRKVETGKMLTEVGLQERSLEC